MSSRARDIQAAQADGVSAALLEAAAHEVGHGLCWAAGGFGIEVMVVRPGLFGGVSDAYCRRRRLWLDPDNIDAYLIGLAGGAAGQTRHLSAHQGHSGWTARSRAHGNAAHDRAEFRRLAPAHGSRLSWSNAVTAAGRLLQSRSTRHGRLTVELARAGQLSGSAL
jgi:hypothetical protein